nr:immunoglobulin light chain junction region [Macaca mulatta]
DYYCMIWLNDAVLF